MRSELTFQKLPLTLTSLSKPASAQAPRPTSVVTRPIPHLEPAARLDQAKDRIRNRLEIVAGMNASRRMILTPRELRIEALRRADLFSGLNNAQMIRLADMMQEKTFA